MKLSTHNEEIKAALNIVMPLIFSNMGITSEKDLTGPAIQITYSYDAMPGRLKSDPIKDLTFSQITAIKILAQYRAAMTGLDEKHFLRTDRRWPERVLEKEPFKGYVNNWMDYVLPKLPLEVQIQICYENPFRPRLMIGFNSGDSIQYRINNENLSEWQLMERLNIYHQMEIPVIIEVSDKVKKNIHDQVVRNFHRRQKEVRIHSLDSIIEFKTAPSYEFDFMDDLNNTSTLLNFTKESLAYAKAVVPGNINPNKIKNITLRRSMKEKFARNALIDEFGKASDYLGTAVNVVNVINSIQDEFQQSGSIIRSTWEGVKAIADISIYDAAYAMLNLELPAPLCILLLTQLPGTSDTITCFTSPPPKLKVNLPYVKTQQVTKELMGFYGKFAEKPIRFLPDQAPVKTKFTPKHEHLWRKIERRSLDPEMSTTSSAPIILLPKPSFSDIKDTQYLYHYPLPACLSHSDSSPNQVWLRDWQAGYTFNAGNNSNFSFSFNLTSLYYLYQWYKYWRMPMAKKIEFQLFVSMREFIQAPSLSNKNELLDTLKDYKRLNPSKIDFVKKIHFYAEIKSGKGLQALLNQDLLGCAKADQDYQDYFIRQSSYFNVRELKRCFPEEPHTYLCSSRFHLSPSHLNLVAARNDIDKAFSVLDEQKPYISSVVYWQTFQDLIATKRDVLKASAKQDENYFPKFKELNDQELARNPQNITLMRSICDDYKELGKTELALEFAKIIQPKGDAADSYKLAGILSDLGNIPETLNALEEVISRLSKQEFSPEVLDNLLLKNHSLEGLAYRCAIQIRDIYKKENSLSDALIYAKLICKNPCSIQDYKILGNINRLLGKADAACEAYRIYIHLQKDMLNPQTKNVLLWLGQFFSDPAPKTALDYYKLYLKIDPDYLVVHKCEKIFVQHKQFIQLREFYLEFPNEYTAGKLKMLDDYLTGSSRLKLTDGILDIIQMSTPLVSYALKDGKEYPKVVKVIQGVNLSIMGIQKVLLPICHSEIQPRWLKSPELKPTRFQKGVTDLSKAIGCVSAVVQLARIFPEKLNEDQRKFLDKATFALEGVSIMVDSAKIFSVFVPDPVKSFSNLSQYARQLNPDKIWESAKSSVYQVSDTISKINWSKTSECLTSSHYQINPGEVWKSAQELANQVGDTVSKTDWAKACEVYGESAAITASMIVMGMRAYEFGLQLSGKDQPESAQYYLVRNFLVWTPASFAAASKIGLSAAGTAAFCKSYAVWVAASVQTGGAWAVAGAAGGVLGATAVVLAPFGAYYGVKYIHHATTVQSQISAIQTNYKFNDLEKDGEFTKIIEGLQKIDAATGKAENKTHISYYQCRQYLKENKFAQAENLTGELLKTELFTGDFKSNVQQLRLIAYVGLSSDKAIDISVPLGIYEEIKNTASPEIKEYSTQTILHILNNRFNHWQSKNNDAGKDWQEGMNILKKMEEVKSDNYHKRQIDLFLFHQYLSQKNYTELEKMQEKLYAVSNELDIGQSFMFTQMQFNASLLLAADDQAFEKYRPMQQYQQLIGRSTDEKERKELTQNMQFILEKNILHSVKTGNFQTAADSAQEAYRLTSNELYQNQSDFYKAAHFLQKKQYDKSEALSTQLLNNRKTLHPDIVANLISLKLNSIAEAFSENKEIKLEKINQAWDDFQEWSSIQSKNKNFNKEQFEKSSEQQIILHLLRLGASLEATQGQFSQAQTQCLRILSLTPEAKDVQELSRTYEYQIHLKNGEYTQLMRKCDLQLAHQPKDILALKYSGLVHLQEQRFKDSSSCFQRLVEMQPQEPEPLLYLFHITRADQNYVRAEQYVNQAAELAKTKLDQHLKEKPEDKDSSQAQYYGQIRQYQESLQSEIKSVWYSSFGQKTGTVAAHALCELTKLGMSIFQSSNSRERGFILDLPTGGKIGNYSRAYTKNPF